MITIIIIIEPNKDKMTILDKNCLFFFFLLNFLDVLLHRIYLEAYTQKLKKGLKHFFCLLFICFLVVVSRLLGFDSKLLFVVGSVLLLALLSPGKVLRVFRLLLGRPVVQNPMTNSIAISSVTTECLYGGNGSQTYQSGVTMVRW